MTNSGVPVSVVDSDADKTAPTDLSIQAPFRLAEPLNVAGIVNTEGESDEPLLRLTITRFTKLNSTSIGAFFSHVLCVLFSRPLFFVLTGTVQVDGYGYIFFLDFVSQYYQGLEPVDSSVYYVPKAIEFPDPSKDPSPIYELFDPSAPHPSELPSRKAMDFVAIRLTAAQLAEIHGTVTKGKEHLRISRVDVVVGIVARCLSEVEPESKPINTIMHVVNVRQFPFNYSFPTTRLISS